MRRPQFKGFWDRAADGLPWGVLVLFGLVAILTGCIGIAIAMHYGTVLAWLVFYGLPFLFFLFWYIIARVKWERRDDG